MGPTQLYPLENKRPSTKGGKKLSARKLGFISAIVFRGSSQKVPFISQQTRREVIADNYGAVLRIRKAADLSTDK